MSGSSAKPAGCMGIIMCEEGKRQTDILRGKGYASLLSQKRSRKPAFVAVKATNATRNKVAVHRFRAASFAGMLCAKRTAKPGVRPEKMSKLIFPDCRRVSSARKLSLRRSSFRRRLFVVVFKLVRPVESRGRRPLAQSSRPRRPRTYSSRQFLFFDVLF